MLKSLFSYVHSHFHSQNPAYKGGKRPQQRYELFMAIKNILWFLSCCTKNCKKIISEALTGSFVR